LNCGIATVFDALSNETLVTAELLKLSRMAIAFTVQEAVIVTALVKRKLSAVGEVPSNV
jgi:hypothetical protein